MASTSFQRDLRPASHQPAASSHQPAGARNERLLLLVAPCLLAHTIGRSIARGSVGEAPRQAGQVSLGERKPARLIYARSGPLLAAAPRWPRRPNLRRSLVAGRRLPTAANRRPAVQTEAKVCTEAAGRLRLRLRLVATPEQMRTGDMSGAAGLRR